ncbi:exodeoxyribonuclease V subunit gamma [Rhodoferax sp. 4810]|uniref:RecBCD enzyme subunit RecC n=2 Tax=Thiospirillum jenense TaxID=1653858 RepID=A0A839HCG6_9GAMM|nr:exodeoxyribonuclease V subunit gamma [Rhodoferax jenense]MBB1126633.1 exodeoxyribonuclease V subunit gamma [Thiospirillum jenense]
MLIQSNRLENLRWLMIEWLKRHPLAPLENDVILVQSNGIAQWLKLALAARPRDDDSGGCGIAAALKLQLPAQFIWHAYRAVLGALDTLSPFDKTPLTWRLYHLLTDLPALQQRLMATATDIAPLTSFIHHHTADDTARRRYQLAERLADLYDQYQIYRADWLDHWQRGEDVIILANGTRQPLGNEHRWQPLLWRCLIDEINNDPQLELPPNAPPCHRFSRAQIHTAFIQQIKQYTPATRPMDLPRRVIVFGLSSLPRQTLEVLHAIKQLTQVLLFVHNPSQHYWGDIIEGRDLFRFHYRRIQARKVPVEINENELHLHGQPLLAAWGKQGRDYIRLLDEYDQPDEYRPQFNADDLKIDWFESPGQACLLHQLQDDILQLRPLHERQALNSTVDPATDHSLQFLIAHSPQREIEILHDQLLATFEEYANSAAQSSNQTNPAPNATAMNPLHPRDILVMVPNIEIYAPHIEAVFGRFAFDDPRYLPFHITDQTQRHRNPLLIALESLLKLPQSRFAVSELFDLLDIPAVRERFAITDNDLPRLHQWIDGANIRWGLNAAQRQQVSLDPNARRAADLAGQHTWEFGLNRLLLGMAVGDQGAWQGIEPYPSIGGLEAALLGHLAQLLDTLENYWTLLQQPATPAEWAARLTQLVDDCFVATSDADETALRRVQQALTDWLEQCQLGGSHADQMPVTVVREALLSALDEPTLSQRFLAGAVNFATLMPMRAIPFRQIWLLGMNDGDYPRKRPPLDFDLMAQAYRPGDRSRREDDRYLFLEALLSARERLVISWVGRDIRDNSERPPSVLVGQLRDHLAAGWRLVTDPVPFTPDSPRPPSAALLEALTTVHPLQPFSRQYFDPHRPPPLFTYTHEWRQIHAPSPPITAPAAAIQFPPWHPSHTVTFRQLIEFLRCPPSALVTQRLQIAKPEEMRAVRDVEPFEIDGLANWQMQDDVLTSLFTHQREWTPEQFDQQLQRSIIKFQAQGRLLAGSQGLLDSERVVADLPKLYQTWRQAVQTWPQPLPSRTIRLVVELPIMAEGSAPVVVLEDSLTGLYDGKHGVGQILLNASHLVKNKQYRWRHAVRPWLLHLAAQLGGEPVTTQLLTPAGEKRFEPLPADAAAAQLQAVLADWWTGMHEPLPVTVNSAMGWLRAGDTPPLPITPTADVELFAATQAWKWASSGFDADAKTDSYLVRCYPNWLGLWSDGHFATWAARLYAPLLRYFPDST